MRPQIFIDAVECSSWSARREAKLFDGSDVTYLVIALRRSRCRRCTCRGRRGSPSARRSHRRSSRALRRVAQRSAISSSEQPSASACRARLLSHASTPWSRGTPRDGCAAQFAVRVSTSSDVVGWYPRHASLAALRQRIVYPSLHV
jgi:hypothetical protein